MTSRGTMHEEDDPHASARPLVEDGADEHEDDARFIVVGIGASAGGLEAISELARHVPLDHMSFIVVQHLSPHHESILPQLLARTSKVQVVAAEEGMTAEPNRIYVAPPNSDLALLRGKIHLLPAGGNVRLPIDAFFRSLAQDRGPRAIGIILSGTGTDGTLGLRAIKEAGGLTFAQDPASARYDGMPRSALASGYTDFCLTPKSMGEELTRIAKRPVTLARKLEGRHAPSVEEQLARLFVMVRAAFGVDLSRYKPSTVERRVERRMTLNRLGSLDEYVKLVQSNPEELRALHKDMLITVTNFFRDPSTFDSIKTRVFPKVLERKDRGGELRIWVPACATGEEAYSIAICLLEHFGGGMLEPRIQIFGTDVDDESIDFARRGDYPHNIEMDVSPERLSRFFVKHDSHYQISRRVRDMIVFSKQNLLRDAPFSRMDLVSCRNLLIYLQPSSQKKVLSVFHYALNPGGFLMLGTSETTGEAQNLFSLVDRKSKVYAKRQTAKPTSLDEIAGTRDTADRAQRWVQPRPALSLQTLTDRKVLEMYSPPGVVINENLDILHFRGHTGPYLDPVPGSASFNILKVARSEFHLELKRSIQQAFSEDKRVATELKFHEPGGTPHAVRLDVVPIRDPETNTRCLLVSFLKIELPPEPPPFEGGPSDSPQVAALERRVKDVEHELEVTRDYLQSTIEDKESANEELRSANEELQSANEELQSTNEELETSREEMQSSNEELSTLNEELQNRMVELGQANDDLHNVLVGIDHATIIVGMDLRIRRFTVSAERLLNLVAGDVGRSIGFLDSFVGRDLRTLVTQVIESLTPVEEEVLYPNQRWYSLRIIPYKTLDHSIRGAVVSFADIDVRKRSARLTRDVGEYADRFLGAIHHPLLIVDAKFKVIWANDAYYDSHQKVPEETLGNVFPRSGDPLAASGKLHHRLEEALGSAQVVRDYSLTVRAPDGSEKVVRIGASRVPLPTESPLLLVSIEDAPGGAKKRRPG